MKKFLNRSGLRKRKITRDDKAIPSVADISAKMKEGQQTYYSFNHSPSSTWNMDETAVTWAIGPTHMYVPKNQQRATNVGIPNTKLRITAIIAVNGLGNFAPLMFVIKHSVCSEKRPDQSKMIVIKKLHQNKNYKFGIDEGWSLILWEKTLTIKGITAEHKCWYLIHSTTGDIITSQYRAWNDTVRMMMWIELVINPIKIRNRKLLLWFDNCGCHKTASVEEILANLEINVACLPPNMTAILQVLDLVVNGPLKAHIRNNRAKKIVESFKNFKKENDENSMKPVVEQVSLIFEAPKPQMMDCISDLINLLGPNGEFQREKFKNGIISSFVKTGTVPVTTDENGVNHFVEYKDSSINGTMEVIPLGTHQMSICPNVESEHVHIAILEYIDWENFSDSDDDLDNSD